MVAVKKLPITSDDTLATIEKEIKIMQECDSDYLVGTPCHHHASCTQVSSAASSIITTYLYAVI